MGAGSGHAGDRAKLAETFVGVSDQLETDPQEPSSVGVGGQLACPVAGSARSHLRCGLMVYEDREDQTEYVGWFFQHKTCKKDRLRRTF